MTDPITREADLDFEHKRKNFIAIATKEDWYLGRICPANFKQIVRDGRYLVSPLILMRLFNHLISTTLYGASMN